MTTSEKTHANPEAIGFIGLGAMGGPIVQWLLSRGYKVVVLDINEDALRAARERGAQVAPSPQAMASEVRMVFTCLPSLGALRSVVFGVDGLHLGKTIDTLVDLSTTGSAFARELAQDLEKVGIALLDAPITGNVVKAGNGTLGIMCSGPRAAFERAEPVMRDFAGTLQLYLGEKTGRAQTLKLMNNLLSATGMATTCEALIVGTKAGLDPATMLEIINAGDASSNASLNKFPKAILLRQFDYGARMAITIKDTSLTVAEAEELGVPMWIGQSVRQVWKYAISQGGGERDGTALITYLEPLAGVEVRAGASIARAPGKTAPPLEDPTAAILLCDASILAAVERRLSDAAATGMAMPCTAVLLRRGCDPLSVLPQRERTSRLILNLCPMPSKAAAEFAASLEQRGDHYVEALPLFGQQEFGSAGAMFVLSGSPEGIAFAKPVLNAFAGRLAVVSERPGDAQLMHQIHESLFATLLAATCEVYVAGAKAGLDATDMSRLMRVGTGRNAASVTLVPEEVATRRFQHGRTLGELRGALSALCETAGELEVTPWILEKARLLYGLAIGLGSAQDDASRLVTHYERWAKVEVRASLTPPSRPPA